MKRKPAFIKWQHLMIRRRENVIAVKKTSVSFRQDRAFVILSTWISNLSNPSPLPHHGSI